MRRACKVRIYLRESQAELAAAQQGLARKQRGSANRKRAKAKVAGIHRKIRNRRADFHHKTARALIASCDAIAVENLNIAAMSQRARPVPDPGQPGRVPSSRTGPPPRAA